MRRIEIPNITIIPVKETEEVEYIALYESEFLKATYCVKFKDTILGAIALHRFSEMIKDKTDSKSVRFNLQGNDYSFKNRALMDVITKRKLLTD